MLLSVDRLSKSQQTPSQLVQNTAHRNNVKKCKSSLDGIPRFTVSLRSVKFSIVFALLFNINGYAVMLWNVMQSLLCTSSANEMSPCVLLMSTSNNPYVC